jgi:hypothetical protein
VLTDLDMKKPLAVGVRGCRAGSPTRLHKEGNALHRLQSSARVMNRDLGFGSAASLRARAAIGGAVR